ncbi:hypothetical protein C7M61_002971 [Candidozyma pseudohaemuli]|uniref:Uncharacterized protein n=1 Tax=Candidozyma pseudohaemuli TaxID=418784 RepID=A0A2P7YR14_9ASCO|nr:hypothetical protein C7M61_002971 [[Candida] pseudohaemulonii]PSK38408.1 hypothetical protein C7M61_002971 [[Candida] pseudohaemulonii]
MSSPETTATPEVEVAPWKPQLDLDCPAGRVCLLEKEDIDNEFLNRLDLFKEKMDLYGDTLKRYYELKVHEKFGTVPADIAEETRENADENVNGEELLSLDRENLTGKLASLPGELQKIEKECLQRLAPPEVEVARWIYEYIYQESPLDRELLNASRFIKEKASGAGDFLDACSLLQEYEKSYLLEYCLSKVVEYRKDRTWYRDCVTRKVKRRRVEIQLSLEKRARDGPFVPSFSSGGHSSRVHKNTYKRSY